MRLAACSARASLFLSKTIEDDVDVCLGWLGGHGQGIEQ